MLDKNVKPDSQETVFALGRQLTIEYYDCAPGILLSRSAVESALLKGAGDSGATIISSSFHKFHPQGVSGVVIISESHFTVHAWPEHDYAAVDIFTCGNRINLDAAIHSMEKSFGSGRVVISSDLNRGLVSSPAETRAKNVFDSRKDRNTLPAAWKKGCDKTDPWGISTAVDIYACVPDIIQNAGMIDKFVKDLGERIGMKCIEDCQVIHFGEGETLTGFSMSHPIDTSHISGHFADATHTAYLNIFSCKLYEPREAAEFAVSFFKAHHYKMQIALRE